MVTVESEYRHMLDCLLKIEEQSSQWYQVSPSLVQDMKNVLDPSQRWRHKICDWYYEFVDHYNFDREAVGIAISYFDRFMSSINDNSFDDKHAMDMYQIVAVTSLFLALKLHAASCEVENLSEARSRALSKILCSTPNPRDILEMELKMLRSFEWHVSPPTMHQFAFLFFKLHPLCDICSASGNYLYESTRYQVELAVYVLELFVRFKPSVVVCAAMKNAEEYIVANNPCMKGYVEKLPARYQEDDLAVTQCQQLLKRLCPQMPDLDYFIDDDDAMVAAPGNDSLWMTRNESNSPTTVADF